MTESNDFLPPRLAALGLVGLTIVGAMALFALAPPRPVPADAAAAVFSAERAQTLVEQLATDPRPLGAASHAQVREQLVAELVSLGLEPQVQATSIVVSRGPRLVGAQVHNLLARLPGTVGGPALLLMAHYDTRPTTAGAGDDMSGVATVLETIRAVRAGPPLARDVIVLLTDAEELGLLGARAFAEQHPWMADVGLVLNFEARGNRGMSTMFETATPWGLLIRGLRDAAPYPWASSLSAEVYRRMPNDTDFSVLRDAGIPGMNFSFIGGFSAYHTALDTPAALDVRSLQHHGSYALSLTQHFGEVDLGTLESPRVVYFNPFGWSMVVYPESWAKLLAVLAVALWLSAMVVALVRRRLSGFALARGIAAVLATLVASAAVAWILWWLMIRVTPGVAHGPYRLPYEPSLSALALLAAVLATSAWIYGWVRTSVTSLGLALAGTVPWAFLTLVTAWSVPGASFLFLFPLLVMAVVLLYLALREPLVTGRRAAAYIAGGLAGVVLLTPVLHLVMLALTLHAAAILAVVAALLLALLAPLLGACSGRFRQLPLVAILAALALWMAASARSKISADQPRVDNLAYVFDADADTAQWLSLDRSADEWTALVLGRPATKAPRPEFLPMLPASVLQNGAEIIDGLQPPRAEKVLELPSSQAGGEGRRLSLFLVSPRGAPTLRMRIEAAGGISGVWLEGVRYEVDAEPAETVSLRYYAWPEAGLALTLELTGPGPVEVVLVDQSYRLPDDAKLRPRPPHIIPSASWFTDTTLVSKRFTF